MLHSTEELNLLHSSLYGKTLRTSYFTLLKNSIYFMLHSSEELYVLHT